MWSWYNLIQSISLTWPPIKFEIQEILENSSDCWCSYDMETPYHTCRYKVTMGWLLCTLLNNFDWDATIYLTQHYRWQTIDRLLLRVKHNLSLISKQGTDTLSKLEFVQEITYRYNLKLYDCIICWYIHFLFITTTGIWFHKFWRLSSFRVIFHLLQFI